MYNFYETKNKVICVSTYAGKTVRGVAKCAPNDEFDLEKGRALAKARCDLKVAALRSKRAEKCYEDSNKALERAENHFDKMCDYLADAEDAFVDAENALAEILAEL